MQNDLLFVEISWSMNRFNISNNRHPNSHRRMMAILSASLKVSMLFIQSSILKRPQKVSILEPTAKVINNKNNNWQ